MKEEYKQAYDFQTRYNQLNSELLTGDLISKITKSRTNYDQHQNIVKIIDQQRIMVLQERFNISLGVVTLLTILLIFVLLRVNRQKQFINNKLDQKVKERTAELEKGRDDLIHAHDEQIIFLKRVSSDLASSFATFKGLSIVAKHDLPKDKLACFVEGELIFGKTLGLVNQYTRNLNV